MYKMLKYKGKYVFRTRHTLTGPYDVSEYYSYEPECFHLKEWTFTGINKVIMEEGNSKFYTYWNAKGVSIKLPTLYFKSVRL